MLGTEMLGTTETASDREIKGESVGSLSGAFLLMRCEKDCKTDALSTHFIIELHF